MIVTCESCQRRYKVDDSKITGRGAKITCPHCKHQFVVYAQSAAPAPAPLAAPESEWDNEERTQISAPRPPAPPSVPSAVQPAAVAQPAAPVAPPPQPRALPPVPPRPEAPVMPPPAAMPPAPVEPPAPIRKLSPAEAAARSPSLDFRKVGVVAWKVKVKIGLIYDFSDLKTIRKYIADGRVTTSDLISYDGKSWTPLGEIPDLDVFFCETYDRLEAQVTKATAPLETAPPITHKGANATIAMPLDDMLSEAGFSAAGNPVSGGQTSDKPRTEPTGPTFRDPFATGGGKKKPAPPKTTPPPATPNAPKGGGSKMLVGVLVALLLLGVVGAVVATQVLPMFLPKPADPVHTEQATPGAPAGEDLRKQLQEEISTGMEPAPNAGAATPGTPGDQVLIPVRPGEKPKPQKDAAPSEKEKGADNKAGLTPEQEGDAAARKGDWKAAASAYGKAAAQDSRNGALKSKQAEAQYKAGDMNGAEASFNAALKLGVKGKPHKYLGYIAKKQGDDAQATFHFQEYLKTNPSDAAAIQRELDSLSGG